MKLIKDLGMKYPTNKSKKKYRYCICACEQCNRQFTRQTRSLIANKNCKKCTITNKTIHSDSYSKIYKVWTAMKQRCSNSNNKSYDRYGGRGIFVCSEWENYIVFKEWALSEYKEGLSIDRIDNNKGYSPDNCRWVDMKVQARNTCKIRKNNTSGYRGVCFSKKDNRWISTIRINNKNIFLGNFTDKLEAAKAYDNYVIANNLEHTINNI